jgi:hypothetical protein
LDQAHLESQRFFLLIEVQESVKKQEIARDLEEKTAAEIEARDGLNNALFFNKQNKIFPFSRYLCTRKVKISNAAELRFIFSCLLNCVSVHLLLAC